MAVAPAPTERESSVISFDDVAKQYGAREVLAGVRLEVCRGEMLALIGRNGAGKTTLIKLALGIIQPTRGEIIICGTSAKHATAKDCSAIGFVPEAVDFVPNATGWEVLRFFARLKGLGKSECTRAFEQVGLAEAGAQSIGTYSKGMRQRLAIAQALLGEPEVLILDEPTGGLDPAAIRELYEIFRELRVAGTTIFVASHALGEMEAHADRVAILDSGSIVVTGSLAQLRDAAGLKMRARLHHEAVAGQRITAVLNGAFATVDIGEKWIELECAGSDRLKLLRFITSHEDLIGDVEFRTPRLDDLFEYFTTRNH